MIRPDDEVVTCPPNADHGHPDETLTVDLTWLRFLDSVYAVGLPTERKGSLELQATRAAWVLTHPGISKEAAQKLKPGCWGVARVEAMRDFLWGEVE